MERLLRPAIADRRRPARGASVVRRANRLPFVLTLILFGLFIPEELSLYLFGLRLSVIRLIFLLLVPVLLVKGWKKLSAGLYRFVPSDLFVIAAGFWLIYAPANIDGFLPALNHAGPTVLEFCVGYCVTRIMLWGSDAALSFAKLLCRTIAVVALIGVLDPMTNHRFVHDLAAQLTAPMHSIELWEDAYRLGLLRATGPVEHPILFGFVCAIGVLIAISVPGRGRLFVILACGVGAMISLSSAPIQIMIMGLGLLTYDFYYQETLTGGRYFSSRVRLGFLLPSRSITTPSGSSSRISRFLPNPVIIGNGHGRWSICTFHNRLGLVLALAKCQRQ